jgi:hypothetical protein
MFTTIESLAGGCTHFYREKAIHEKKSLHWQTELEMRRPFKVVDGTL